MDLVLSYRILYFLCCRYTTYLLRYSNALLRELLSFLGCRKLLFCPREVAAFRGCLLGMGGVFLRISMPLNKGSHLSRNRSEHQPSAKPK
jgi:hypothetical protein